MGAAIIPGTDQIDAIVEVLKEIRDVGKDRLQVEKDLLHFLRFGPVAIAFAITATIDGKSIKEIGKMALQLTDIQKCDLTVSPVDAKGNAAPVEGAPAWTVSDPTILGITAAADGLSASIVALGPLGTCQVNVSADADLGEGVTTIAGTLDVEVVSSQATALNIGTGTPANQ